MGKENAMYICDGIFFRHKQQSYIIYRVSAAKGSQSCYAQ